MIDAALIELLRPLVRQLVAEEVERVGRRWRWLTTEQVGELLGISSKAVRTRVERGQLRGRKIEGRLYFDVADLDELVARGPVS